MAKKATTKKKAAKADSKKAVCIDLLRKQPMTVAEITKATGMSTAYVRTLLFSPGKAVKAEHRATTYRVVGEVK